jgi:hypothetical protein
MHVTKCFITAIRSSLHISKVNQGPNLYKWNRKIIYSHKIHTQGKKYELQSLYCMHIIRETIQCKQDAK